MSRIDEAIEKLGGLYTITGEDWSLRLHISLTEPTCPTAVISPDGWDISRYRCDGNSIEDAIVGAADVVHREVILREQAVTFECYTEGDDKLYKELRIAIRGILAFLLGMLLVYLFAEDVLMWLLASPR